MKNKYVKLVKESGLEQSKKDILIYHFENETYPNNHVQEPLFEVEVYCSYLLKITFPTYREKEISGEIDIDFQNKIVRFGGYYEKSFDEFLNDFMNDIVWFEWVYFSKIEKIRLEKERKSKNALAKVKLIEFSEIIENLKRPEINSEEAKSILSDADLFLSNISKYIKEKSEKL